MFEQACFSPTVVEAITRHMNDDHAADNVIICRALGGVPDASTATMTGLDHTGLTFAVGSPAATTTVQIPWRHPVTERAQVRAEIVRMYQDACAALGIEPGH